MSALRGDNVVDRGDAMPWYDGPTLLEHLETIELAGDRNLDDRRFPVQWVIRPMADEHHDYRGYAGEVAGGSGAPATRSSCCRRAGARASRPSRAPTARSTPRSPPSPSTIRLEDDVDVGRGDMLADPDAAPRSRARAVARICWMSERPLEPRAKLAVKHTTRVGARGRRRARLAGRHAHARQVPAPERLELNDLGVVKLRLSEPLAVDLYPGNRATGAFILIDEATNDTVAAGMVVPAS